MKKRTWMILALIAVCLTVFFVYRSAANGRRDTQPPVIRIEEQFLEISVLAPESELMTGITAEDDRDGDVTAGMVVESVRLVSADGTANVTYAAFDSAGNVSKATRQIRYTDYQSPRFCLSASLAVSQSASTDVLSLIQVTDLLDGDITHRLRATSLNEESVADLGSHSVEFTVTNSIGDTVELILPVEVYAAGTYSGTLTLTDYLIYLPVGADFVPEDYLGTFTLGREAISLTGKVPQTVSVRTDGTVDTQTPGVYSVGYTVYYRDDTGTGESQSAYSMLIVIVEE